MSRRGGALIAAVVLLVAGENFVLNELDDVSESKRLLTGPAGEHVSVLLHLRVR